jgi:protein tweety
MDYLLSSGWILIAISALSQTYEFYEQIRWPATLGYLTFLLLLCTILVIGVARSSRCALIFFSVFGLLAVTICWLISGIYLSTTVALADFCMKPQEYLCSQVSFFLQ